MYIYRVVLTIDKDAESEWLDYMQHKHIAEVLATGYFTSCSIRKLWNENEEAASTFNIEYAAPSVSACNEYVEHSAPALRADLEAHFGGRYTAQRSIYEIISETKG